MSVKGTVFDIQRFSIHDGPGIRTTVFFKGCSLRCQWCHNPESQKRDPEIAFYEHKCTSCGKCRAFCDKLFTSACNGCGRCVSVCPHGARELLGRTESAEDVFSVIIRDKEFYITSGGGVTLSGGEPLLQADFAAEILRMSKQAGIHTAIETAGNVPWESFLKVLPYCDLFLYDIKAMDPLLHKRLTGADNAMILQNARLVEEGGKEILFRMPVVPGYNSGEVEKVAEFCRGKLEILSYHETGKGKYASLNMPYIVTSYPPSEEEMFSLAKKTGAIYHPTGI